MTFHRSVNNSYSAPDGLALALSEELWDSEADGESDGEADGDGETDALGESDAEPLSP